MAGATFFSRFGFLAVPGFVEAEMAAALSSEMAGAAGRASTVQNVQQGGHLDEDMRRSRSVRVSAATQGEIEARLAALRPRVEAHFSLALARIQPVQFLDYRPGDFFRLHRDREATKGVADFVRSRRISAVLFLNEWGQEADHYQGGELTFYGLFPNPRLGAAGVALDPQAGLLVCFPSEILHEVKPVVSGARHTAVTWFE